MFYTSLGRLLMVDLGEDEDRFEAFMIPLTQAFESLGQVRYTYSERTILCTVPKCTTNNSITVEYLWSF